MLTLPNRQFVFTLPKALRVFLRYDQRLFADLARLIFSLIAEFCSVAAGKPISTAAVVAYQAFGDSPVIHISGPSHPRRRSPELSFHYHSFFRGQHLPETARRGCSL